MTEKVLYIDNRERSGLEDLVKKYCDINKIVSKAVKRYRNDVKKKLFPTQNNSF